MKGFPGFPEGKIHLIPVPEAFFSELLQEIDHLGELKLLLFLFWRLENMEGTFRYFRRSELEQNQKLAQLLGNPQDVSQAISDCLHRAVQRGVLLSAQVNEGNTSEEYFFINSPKGRAALRAIESGAWRISAGQTEEPPEEFPNIYQLYEENIGPLTPMLADALAEAEQTYPATWISEAFQIAVEKNKRNWRYILAILERWQREGPHVRKRRQQDRSHPEEDRRRYVEGEFSDFIEH